MLQSIMHAVEITIQEMIDEHKAEDGANHTAPVLQNQTFEAALVFLKDRITTRITSLVVANARKHDHHFHPKGRCTCAARAGAGRCEWCMSIEAQFEGGLHPCNKCGGDIRTFIAAGGEFPDGVNQCVACNRIEVNCTCDPLDVAGEVTQPMITWPIKGGPAIY
jgi:hypothetical protein